MNHKKKAGIALGITLAGMIGIILLYCIYYSNRWYLGTTVNGLEVSGQTMEESKQYLLNEYRDYTLTVTGRGGVSLSILGSDINYTVCAGDDWENIYTNQHDTSLVSLDWERDYTVELDVTYDREVLKKIVMESELIRGSEEVPIEPPVSASVVYSEEKGQYICKKEVKGNQLNRDVFLDVIETALKLGRTEIDINDDERYKDVYHVPEITSENKELQNEISLCNNAVLRYICWDMGDGMMEEITPKQIANWIIYKNGRVTYKKEAISTWVRQFCRKYQTVGKPRTIQSHTGKKVKIVGGDYGWQTDYNRTLKQVRKALNKNIDRSLTEAYMENPSSKNKRALTMKRKPLYLNTAYRRNRKNPLKDWDLKNYTEISLNEQMVYVLRKGKVAFSCRCITGLPVAERMTRTGAYYIKEHRSEYTMTGDDYRTHVKHWVRITWTGTGFHPATWQPWSKWTNTLYKAKGSHGCINLSPADAEKIYNLVKYREAVFIHY